MRNALVRKILLVGFIWIALCLAHTFAQYKEMFVPLKGQQTGSWCWAAAMEMVLDFHNPLGSASTHQCDFVESYRVIKNLGTSPCCTPGNCDGITLPFAREGALDRDYYDMLFSNLHYHSAQIIHRRSAPMSWDHIKKEIDDCHPFLLFIKPQPGPNSPVGDFHVIVAKGYLEIGTLKYIITNDPWKLGVGDVSLFPYHIFTTLDINYVVPDPTYYIINTVLAVVENIYPDTIFPGNEHCLPCNAVEATYRAMPIPSAAYTTQIPDTLESLISENLVERNFRSTDTIDVPAKNRSLVAALLQNKKAVIGFEHNVLKDNNYQELLQKNIYYDAPVKFIDFDKMNLPTKRAPKLLAAALIIQADVVEVVTEGVGQNFVSTFEEIKDKNWLLRSIATQSALRKELKLTVPKLGDIVLSNKKGALFNPNAMPYELIKYPPFEYECYSFKVGKGAVYMVPAQDYESIGVKAGIAYTQRDMLQRFSVKTRSYVKAQAEKEESPKDK